MRKSLQFLLGVFASVFSWQAAQATHIVGGEMIYKCLGGDQYEITLKVYRDCYNGLAAYDNPAYIFIFNSSGVVTQTLSVFFPGSDTLDNETGNPCLIEPPNICVEEAVYITTVTLPPISGGYTLVYQRCCRNGSLISNLIDPDNTGATYIETIPDTSLAVCNSSPYYINFPPTIICVNQDFVFDHSASDPDGDSLVYYLCPPFVGASSTNPQPTPGFPPAPPPYPFVSFLAPYTSADPMGGNPPMAIDPVTGELTVHPETIGNFVVGICAGEYRDGVLIGEHKRDFQFNVADCQPAVVASTPNILNNCAAYTIDFENNSIGGTVYHWDFGITGSTTDTSNLFQPTFTFPDTGIYIVTLMVNPGTVCGDTTTATVYVYPTMDAVMSAPDGCEGQSVQFFDQSTSVFGTINTWTWDFGDGGTSTQQNPNYSYAVTGTYTVTLIAQNDLGCVDTIIETVTIFPAPVTDIQPSDTLICYLDAVQLIASGTGTFSWNPNYELSNPDVFNPVATPDVTTTYTVTVSNTFGCFDTASITISVIDTVLVDAGPDQVICPGESVQLNATGGTTYSWAPTGGLNNPNIASPVASPAGTTTYVVTSTVGSCVGSDVVTVEVKPFPVIFAGPDQTICEGDTVQISASGGTEYSWAPENSLTDPNIADPLAFPASTTTYLVTATDSNSCPKVITDTLIVNVLTMPQITITDDTTIILGTCVDLQVTGGSSYQWIPPTGLDNPASANPVACPVVPTTYYVYITTDDGCVYVDSVKIDIKLEPLLIFPNAFSPNGDATNDIFRPVILGLAGIDEFRIFNRWGEVIFEVLGIDVAGGPMPVEFSWDGKYKGEDQPVGVYVYYLKGVATATGAAIERQGNFTLVR